MDKFKNLNKLVKVIVILVIIILVIVLFDIISNRRSFHKLQDYLVSNGYSNNDGSNIYYKQISDNSLEEYLDDVNNKIDSSYEVNSFDTIEKKFQKNKREYTSGMDSILNANYFYRDDKINYSYRVSVNNSSVGIFRGEYYFTTKEVFTCNREYIYNFDAYDNDDLICNKIKYELFDFNVETSSVLSNELIKYVKK